MSGKVLRPENCSLYIASPFGFSEAGRDFYEVKFLQAIRKRGYKILDPWKLSDQKMIDAVLSMPYGPKKREAFRKLNQQIGDNNINALNICNGVVAVLDGPDVDSGVAGEIGFAFGLKKPIIGYRNDFRMTGENEGCKVNLQVERFITASGGLIVSSLDELAKRLDSVFLR